MSVIDMPPAEDTIWWRGKRGFEVSAYTSQWWSEGGGGGGGGGGGRRFVGVLRDGGRLQGGMGEWGER